MKIREYWNKIYNIITKKELKILPGHLAFFFILSLVPLITLISFICSSLSFSIDDITAILTRFMPSDVSNLVYNLLSNTNGLNLSFFTMIVGFYIASNSSHSIILISNMLYGIENRNYLYRRIKAFLILIMLMAIFAFTLIIMVFGNNILSFILSLDVFSNISNDIYNLFVYIKYPVSFLLTYFFIMATYTMAPDTKISSRYVSKGALFTTICWIIVTAVYSYYANNLAHYNIWYGSLSSIVVLMVWFYIISYILVIGIAINVAEYEKAKKNNIKKK